MVLLDKYAAFSFVKVPKTKVETHIAGFGSRMDPAEVLGETLKPRNSHWFRALEGLMVRCRTLACHQTEVGAAGEEASLSSG